jgi:RimJ/RimL family protein N-acetyltransferase
MKTLETERLRLRARTFDDLEAILAMDADVDVRRFIGGPPDAAAHRAEVRRHLVEGLPNSEWRWAVEWRDRPGFLGQIGLKPCHLPACSELTWRLARVAWGQGVATEAVAAMLGHARAELGIRSVVAFIEAGNQASRRVADKIGLQPAGETVLHGLPQLTYRLD